MKSGDRLGIKIDMKIKEISLFVNGSFVSKLWQHIPDCIIPAISNGNSCAEMSFTVGEGHYN